MKRNSRILAAIMLYGDGIRPLRLGRRKVAPAVSGGAFWIKWKGEYKFLCPDEKGRYTSRGANVADLW